MALSNKIENRYSIIELWIRIMRIITSLYFNSFVVNMRYEVLSCMTSSEIIVRKG